MKRWDGASESALSEFAWPDRPHVHGLQGGKVLGPEVVARS